MRVTQSNKGFDFRCVPQEVCGRCSSRGTIYIIIRPKKILFVSCNGLKKNRVVRSEIFFFKFKFLFKMCVFCMFYVDYELEGQNKL